MAERQKSNHCKNLVLSTIASDAYDRLSKDLEQVVGVLGHSIIHENERAEWAFFPEEAVLSMIRILEDGSMVEVGVVGFDGMVGFQSLTDSPEQLYRGVVQNPGSLWRLPI